MKRSLKELIDGMLWKLREENNITGTKNPLISTTHHISKIPLWN
jgi:hypothetical protein